MTKFAKNRHIVASLVALASEPRLAIIELLAAAGPGGCRAGDIAKQLGIRVITLSYHLRTLGSAGLVEAQRQGRTIRYRLRVGEVDLVIRFLADRIQTDTHGQRVSSQSARAGNGDFP